MSAAIGVNVDAIGTYRAADLKAAGVQWARLVALPEVNAINYLTELRLHGIKTLLVLASESFHGAPWAEMVAEYQHRYAGLVDAVQAANEPDIESPSSWTMSPDDLNRLLSIAYLQFSGVPIIGPGLASGNPDWAKKINADFISAYAVHPYGRRPERDNIAWTETPGNFGYVGDLLDEYAKLGKPLWVSEVGVSTTQVTETFQARYCHAMMKHLRDRKDTQAALWFAWSDQVPGFGLTRSDGSKKPSWDAFAAVATEPLLEEQPEPAPRFVLGFEKWANRDPWLIKDPIANESSVGSWQVQPTTAGLLAWNAQAGHHFIALDGATYRYVETPPEPEPEPHPELHFSAEQIASALGAPLGNVRQHWPGVQDALRSFEITSRPAVIAVLATIGVEVAR